MKKTPCFVNLRIVGKQLDLHKITENIGIVPDISYKKDEVRIVKVGHKEEEVVYQQDGWVTSIGTKYNKRNDPIETIENVINRFIEMIHPATEYLKFLSSKAEITFWIDVYPESEQQNIHISKDVIKSLFEMGITLDCSMTFLKELLNNT